MYVFPLRDVFAVLLKCINERINICVCRDCVKFSDIVNSCIGYKVCALRGLPLKDETREGKQKCLTQLKSKVDETADGSRLYYHVH